MSRRYVAVLCFVKHYRSRYRCLINYSLTNARRREPAAIRALFALHSFIPDAQFRRVRASSSMCSMRNIETRLPLLLKRYDIRTQLQGTYVLEFAISVLTTNFRN